MTTDEFAFDAPFVRDKRGIVTRAFGRGGTYTHFVVRFGIDRRLHFERHVNRFNAVQAAADSIFPAWVVEVRTKTVVYRNKVKAVIQ